MAHKNKLAFTTVTALFLIGIVPGAVLDIAQPDFVVEMGGVLGVPLGLFALIGVWKLLGVVALGAPLLRRLGPNAERVREWAYAGFFFDLTGAAYLHAAAGDVAGVAPPLVFAALLLTSYSLRPSAAETPATRQREDLRAVPVAA